MPSQKINSTLDVRNMLGNFKINSLVAIQMPQSRFLYCNFLSKNNKKHWKSIQVNYLLKTLHLVSEETYPQKDEN